MKIVGLTTTPLLTTALWPIQSKFVLAEDHRSLHPVNDTSDTTPSTSSSSCPTDRDYYNVKVTIGTDNNPHQTGWDFKRHSSGTVSSNPTSDVIVASESSYSSPDTNYEHLLCLEKPNFYSFHLYDTAGDGILSPGHFEVDFDGTVLSSGEGGVDPFGDVFSHVFGDSTPAPPNTITCPRPPSSPHFATSHTTLTDDDSGRIDIDIVTGTSLCTLSLFDVSNGDYVPVARSYDNQSWELSVGPFNTPKYASSSSNNAGNDPTFTPVLVGCNSLSCTINVTTILNYAVVAGGKTNSTYELRLTSYPPYLDPTSNVMDRKGLVTKFLEQATFGPTLNDVTDGNYWNYQGTNGGQEAYLDQFKHWINDQMNPTAVQMSSHREFFRKRLNPRLDYLTSKGQPGPGSPCDKDSRWRNFAFTAKDDIPGRVFSISSIHPTTTPGTDPGPPYVLKIDGHVRTVVDQPVTLSGSTVLELDKNYPICEHSTRYFQEGFGQLFRIQMDGGSCYKISGGVPLVDIREIESSADTYNLHIIDLTTADLIGVDDSNHASYYWSSYEQGDEFILRSDFESSSCATIPNRWSSDAARYSSEPIFGKLFDESTGTFRYLLFDPRLQLIENTVDKPSPDGGGSVTLESDGRVFCANTHRNFLNEENCVLSYEETACVADDVTAKAYVNITEDFLETLSSMSGRELYAFDNLPLNNEVKKWKNKMKVYYTEPPCRKRQKIPSRWMRVDPSLCSATDGSYRTINPATEALFASLLDPAFDRASNPSPLLKTVERHYQEICHNDDKNKFDLGIIKGLDDTCWKQVHIDHLDVFDMTSWFDNSNPISDWIDIRQWASDGVNGTSRILNFPSHLTNKWFFDNINNHKTLYPVIDKMGDVMPYSDLPSNLKSEPIGDTLSELAFNPGRQGVVVCGSVGEVANDPQLGSAFDVNYGSKDLTPEDTLPWKFYSQQRMTVWAYLSLYAKDQLRQRVAFALSQILTITADLLGDNFGVESTLQYYDIFVRGAFGSYRDVLKQVSFSSKMGVMLSSQNSKSYQYVTDNGYPAYPDENFSREIMQLFSIGLVQLNMDGTPILDVDGTPVETYSNDHILSYARAWTGLESIPWRGNTDARSSRVEPMQINGDWRDPFPKSDLQGGYIGDRYPLCVDLPSKQFLRKGATYRLLGSTALPELQQDPSAWGRDSRIRRMKLKTTSPLYGVLCKDEGNGCTFPSKVVLTENLMYDGTAMTGQEYSVDAIRTVQVQGGDDVPIYYEYVRPPCVEQAYYQSPKKVEDYASNLSVRSSLCADPRSTVAAEACCSADWATGSGQKGKRFCEFNGERLTFAGATDRCAANGFEQCTAKGVNEWSGGVCALYQSSGLYYTWTQRSCSLQAKVASTGYVAIVHDPEADYAGKKHVSSMVASDSQNFFLPAWYGDAFPIESCSSTPGCELVEGDCLCDISLSETVVFQSAPTREEALASLFIGAPDPESIGNYVDLACGVVGVTVFSKQGGTTDCSSLDKGVIFFVKDNHGVEFYLKNLVSVVEIVDGSNAVYAFRNPVHFISFVDPEVRDAYYETDAVLDSYFFHPSHPPFLASRMLQRFGISNPSPRFVRAVAEAYASGTYEGIGSGEYGSLAALIAAILLDPESRSVSLASDPSIGQLREPLIKLVSFLRSMEYFHDSPLIFPLLAALQDRIGQGSHEIPSVFSYFLPENVPAGPIGEASLVSPEAQVTSGTRILELLDGLFSTVKYGLASCGAGLQRVEPSDMGCSTKDGSTATRSYGELKYSPTFGTPAELVDEVSLLLTSSRLSPSKKASISAHINNDFQTDPSKALRVVQQAIATTPEFHSTNIARQSATKREEPVDEQPATKEYKAVVFLMYTGGMDSHNLLVPKENCGATDLYGQYLEIRGEQKALASNELLPIDASTSNQPCNTFGVNTAFPVGKTLYDDGSAVYFADVGVLHQPVDKYNYTDLTDTRLFAHNHQQREVMKMDIEKEMSESGVGGRMLDVLKRRGYKTSANTVNTHSVFVVGSAVDNNPTRELSSSKPAEFNKNPTTPYLNDLIYELNGKSYNDKVNSLYGETWSARLYDAIAENKESMSLASSDLYDVPEFQSKPTNLDKKFRAIAEHVKARGPRKVERDVFFVADGGYDQHSVTGSDNLETNLARANHAIKKFVDEMKQQGIWDQVLIVTGSEFGRTLTPNSGEGTGHGWAGNYIMAGGDVDGGRILGSYPNDLSEDSLFSLDRGRRIPTTPWDAVWNGVAQWMDVTDETDLDYVLPNRHNFDRNSLFTKSDLFKQTL